MISIQLLKLRRRITDLLPINLKKGDKFNVSYIMGGYSETYITRLNGRAKGTIRGSISISQLKDQYVSKTITIEKVSTNEHF